MAGNSLNEHALEVEVDGTKYVLNLGDYTGEDDRDLYQHTGFTLMDVFANGKLTLFTLAGLVWLTRRRHEPKLRYEQVAKRMRFDSLATVRDAIHGQDEPSEGTEAKTLPQP